MRKRITQFIILCFLFLFILNLCACKLSEIELRMFSNMEECNQINELKVNDAEVEIYDSALKDKDLNDLAFQEYFGCKYTCDDFSFTLFAYEFSDSDVAMAYFENVTGKETNPNPTFSDSSGIGSFRRIVVAENKAYTVYSKNDDKNEVIEFINNWFSLDVD